MPPPATKGDQADLDLEEPSPAPGDAAPPPPAAADSKFDLEAEDAYQLVPYNPERELNNVRAKLAYRLVWILAGTIVVMFGLIACGRCLGLPPDEVSDFAAPIFSALITLVSTCIGFYFGGNAGRDKAKA